MSVETYVTITLFSHYRNLLMSVTFRFRLLWRDEFEDRFEDKFVIN